MNLLAHFFLSGTNEQLLTVGNFLGDFVKGKKYMNYAPEVRKGILLHRAIDSFTDHHPMVIQSKRRLYSRYHHYSSVLVDLYYDYVLASGFNKFSEQALPVFVGQVYTLLDQHLELFPEQAKITLPYMKRDNWLLNYSRLEGIDKACKGLAQHRPHASSIASGVEELEEHFSLFEAEFHLFFPDIQEHVEKWLRNYGN